MKKILLTLLGAVTLSMAQFPLYKNYTLEQNIDSIKDLKVASKEDYSLLPIQPDGNQTIYMKDKDGALLLFKNKKLKSVAIVKIPENSFKYTIEKELNNGFLPVGASVVSILKNKTVTMKRFENIEKAEWFYNQEVGKYLNNVNALIFGNVVLKKPLGARLILIYGTSFKKNKGCVQCEFVKKDDQDKIIPAYSLIKLYTK